MCEAQLFFYSAEDPLGPKVNGTEACEALGFRCSLSCYPRLKVERHSDSKLEKKNVVHQGLEGTRACCAPSALDPPLY